MENITKLYKLLEDKRNTISSLKCCIGFDGFVDKLIRVVQTRESIDQKSFFKTITEFSQHIGAVAGKSGDMEVVVQEVKLGGNAPIMANAIAAQGVECYCIGAMGVPEIHPAFKSHNDKFIPISICRPAETLAFEFEDGKLMFGDSADLHKIDWEFLKQSIGLQKLIDMISESSLVGAVNWSYLPKIDSIILGIIQEILSIKKKVLFSPKIFFFDLADPSTRMPEELLKYLKLLGQLSQHVKVVLGLNEKEALIVHKVLGLNGEEADIEKIAKNIIEDIDISMLVVHGLDYAIGATENENIKVPGFYVDNPKSSTGGGDNFNGGFCMGLLLGLSVEQSLILGNATSSFYVGRGYSPNYSELLKFINEKQV